VLQVSQSSGIIGYKPEDQVTWSSKVSDSVDIKGISSSSSSPIWYRLNDSWSASATPPGCAVAGSSSNPPTQSLNLIQSSASPPSIFLNESIDDSTSSKIPTSDAGLVAPQLSEILPNPASPKTDANDEYIELYNPNDKPFDLSGFKLKAGTSSTSTYTFDDGQFTMQPHEFKAYFSSTTNLSLSNTSSKISLLSPDDELLSQSDIYYDAKDDTAWVFADGLWQWTPTITANARNIIPSSTAFKSSALSASTSRPPSTTVNHKYSYIQISELLPHPQKPQTDAADEYIEIYNPNTTTVNLAGYILISGIKDDHKYVVKKGTILPHAYKVFYRSESKLTLSNSEGRAKILAPNGAVVDASSDYSKATAGQSWIYANGKWQWTVQPTPGKTNVLSAPVVLGQKTTAIGRANTSKTFTNGLPSGSVSSGTKTPLHPLVLVGVGAAALLYALYEYRHDLANYLYKLRANRESRQIIGR
jgi:hypothetical protein